MDETLATAAAHWSDPPPATRRHWWQHEAVVRHVNRLICGKPVSGIAGGDLERLRERGPFGRAVSVGCGAGGKEMVLMGAGVVERFDLYEIAEARVAQGRERAAQVGLADRISWHTAPVDVTSPAGDPFDLVYWNSALHHMLDVERAVAWSRASLTGGGTFYMNDYVGPVRFQWPDSMLAVANDIRRSLGAPQLGRPDPDRLAAADPTEAADSEAILPAVREYFPNAEVALTGGVVYHLALRDQLDEIDEGRLNDLLALDARLAASGQTHFAVAVA